MRRRRQLPLALALAAAALGSAPAFACDGGDGRVWMRQPAYNGITWDQLAAQCPVGGGGPCTGALAGWVWANADDVLQLFSCWAPQLASQTCAATVVDVGAGGAAVNALGANFRYSTSFSMYAISEGWVSTREASGAPMYGAAYESVGVNQMGGYAVGALTVTVSSVPADAGSSYRGAWLYRADAGAAPSPVVSCVAPLDAGAAPADAGVDDGGSADAGRADAGSADAGRSDGGVRDGGAPDAGETPGAAEPVHLRVGCSSGAELPFALLLLAVLRRLDRSNRRGVRESRPCNLDDSPS